MDRFAIVDIETTGSHARGHGITEIALVITDGCQVLDRWETLVDPGLPIPAHITNLTGIDDDMVQSAPTFEAIADELEDWLSDAVFVAHNVGFDYAFIRGHFETMGRIWKRPKLCTVRMARKLLPGHGSYSLGRICQDLGISNEARHRAMGDCTATVELFHRMMQTARAQEVVNSMLKRGERESWLPQHVPATDFERLPTKPGVYRFLDRKGTPIYIGMSHNVRHRVRTHFNGDMASARRQAFLRDIYCINAEETGTALMARLLEDELIRKHWPIHNRAQKSVAMRTAIIPYTDQKGFNRFHLKRQRNIKQAMRWFYRDEDARSWLHSQAREYEIDPELLGLGSDGRSTVRDDSKAAIASHNQGVRAIEQAAKQSERIAIIEQGRHHQESAIILVNHGIVQGWCYTEESIERFEQLEDLVPIKPGSATSDAIVQHALQEFEAGKITLRVWKEPATKKPPEGGLFA